jgi:allantoicase
MPFVDLAALENGGRVVECSNMFYGSPNNLLMPGLAGNMGEGWETSRRRGEGNDWVLIELAVPGRIQLAEMDTTHFKGNAPGRAGLRGVDARHARLDQSDAWMELLPISRLQPDTRHRFQVAPASEASEVTHVRMDVYPDGGMARLRLHGAPSQTGLRDAAARWFNALPESQAQEVVSHSSLPEVRRLVDVRPVPASDLPPQLWQR